MRRAVIDRYAFQVPARFPSANVVRVLLSVKRMATMITRCPHCRCASSHEVVETNPDLLHWSDRDTIKMFERIAGLDISYRLHTRHCVGCHRRFEAAEVSYHHLSALIGEAKRAGALARQLVEERGKVDALREQLQQVADVALSRPAHNGAHCCR